MTAVLTVALLFATPVAPTPSSVGVDGFQSAVAAGPVTARLDPLWKEMDLWPTAASSAGAVTAPAFNPTSYSFPVVTESVPIPPPATSELSVAVSPPLTAPTPPEPTATRSPATPIEQGLARLEELGATAYQLRIFGCLAWFESRNDPYAIHYNTNGSVDRSLWQINSIHAAKYAGRDIFDPVVNAEVAWQIYQSSGWRAWAVAPKCGV